MKLKNCLSMTLSIFVLFSYIHNIKAACTISECNNVSDDEVFDIMLNFISKRPDRTYKKDGSVTHHGHGDIVGSWSENIYKWFNGDTYINEIKPRLNGIPESDYNLNELKNEFMKASSKINPRYCYIQSISPDHCGGNVCNDGCICKQKTFRFYKNQNGEDGTFEKDCNYMVTDFKEIKQSFLKKLQNKCSKDCKNKRKQMFDEFVEEHGKDLRSRVENFISQQVAEIKEYGSDIGKHIKKKIIEYYDSENEKYIQYLDTEYDYEINQLNQKKKDYFDDVDNLPLSGNLTPDKKIQMKQEYQNKTEEAIIAIRNLKQKNINSSEETKKNFKDGLYEEVKKELENIVYKDKTKKEKIDTIIKDYKSTIDKTINDAKIALQKDKQERDKKEKEEKENLEKELEKFKEYDRLLKLEKEKWDKLTDEEKERIKEKEEFQKKLKEFEEQNKRGFITDPKVIEALISNQRTERIYKDDETVRFCSKWKLEYNKLKVLNEKANKFDELDVKVQCDKFNELKLHKNVDLSKPLDNLSTQPMGYREDVTVYYCDDKNQRLEGTDCIKVHTHVCNDLWCIEWNPNALCWGCLRSCGWFCLYWDSCCWTTGLFTVAGGECNSRVKLVHGDGWIYVPSNSRANALIDWVGGWNGNYSGRCVKTERTPAKSRTIYKYHINLPDIGLKRDIKLDKSYDPNFTPFTGR